MASSFGGTVKLTGESEYRKALKEITSSLKLVSSEIKLTNTQFSNGDKSIKQTKTSYDNMSKTLEEQKTKVSALRGALAQAEKEYGSNNEKVKMFKTQLNNAEAQLKQMENQTDKSTKELKDMKEGFDDAGKGALTFSDVLKANVLSDVIVSGLKALGSAVLEIGKSFVNIGKQAIDSYADYEQLIGGVETLFGESSGIVESYANNAYKTAGLSANEYMETVTSFSASLLQSLNGDTAKSAKVADMAISDMSDNANKMGTDMSMIQNAYQGFAKQNYTMLDNLKLGYGGTKTEMQRLLKDAEKLSGQKYDISNLNDVYEAIHVVQEEMGITGTTAKEASQTISGSTSAMKSAWQNLLTGIADDNADFSGLVNNFVESIVTVANNILPRVEIVIDGIIELVVQLVQKIVEQLPTIMSAGSDILYRLIDGITTMIPEIGFTAFTIIQEFLTSIIEMLPTILQMGIDLLLELVNGISQTLPELIPTIIDAVILMVETLMDNIDMIIDAGIQLILGLADGLIEALPRLIEKIPIIIEKLINAIVNNLPKIIEMGITLIVKLAEGLVKAIPQLISKIPQIISALVSGFGSFLSNMREIGGNIVSGIWEGIKNAKDWLLGKVKEWCGNIVDAIKNFFGIHSPSTIFRDQVGKFMAEGIGVGFENEMENVTEQMQNAIPTEFDINSTLNGAGSNNLSFTLKEAFMEAFKEFRPVVILNGEKIGEYAFEYGNLQYGKYYN